LGQLTDFYTGTTNNRFGLGISTEIGVRSLEWNYLIESAYINGGLEK